MIIEKPCAIRGCPKMARIQHDEYLAALNHFYLCHDCETSILLDTHLRMEDDNDMLKKTTLAFMTVFNEWSRKRRGATIPHKSGVATATKYHGPITITGSDS